MISTQNLLLFYVFHIFLIHGSKHIFAASSNDETDTDYSSDDNEEDFDARNIVVSTPHDDDYLDSTPHDDDYIESTPHDNDDFTKDNPTTLIVSQTESSIRTSEKIDQFASTPHDNDYFSPTSPDNIGSNVKDDIENKNQTIKDMGEESHKEISNNNNDLVNNTILKSDHDYDFFYETKCKAVDQVCESDDQCCDHICDISSLRCSSNSNFEPVTLFPDTATFQNLHDSLFMHMVNIENKLKKYNPPFIH